MFGTAAGRRNRNYSAYLMAKGGVCIPLGILRYGWQAKNLQVSERNKVGTENKRVSKNSFLKDEDKEREEWKGRIRQGS